MDSDPFVASLLRMTRGTRFAPQDDPRHPRCPILTGFGRPRL